MILTLENILLVGSFLLILSVFFSKSSKYGIPTVVLFLLVGMLAGTDGIGQINFFDIHLSKFIGTVALILILFSGGLDTRFADIKPVIVPGMLLSTLGVIITALATGVFIWSVTHLSLVEGLLLGSIISSTDAASVFSIFRAKNTGLKGRIRPLLELESGSNDPMAYFLTLFFIFILKSEAVSFSGLVFFFIKQFAFGIPFGIFMGFAIVRIINRISLNSDGLYSVFLIAIAVFTFAVSDFIGGNGFLSVYIAAVILGNRDFVHKRSLTKHFDGQAWLMQIIMFLTLGLLVNPKELLPVIPLGLLFFFFILLIARPLAVFLSLIFSGFNLRSKFFISWVGLRGAVPIIFSIYALDANLSNGPYIFNLVFFISLLSVLLQGSTISWVASLLGLSVPIAIRKKSAVEAEYITTIKPVRAELEIRGDSPFIKKSLVSLALPKEILISMVTRDEVLFVPDGTTVFQEGDRLTIMTDTEEIMDGFRKQINPG